MKRNFWILTILIYILSGCNDNIVEPEDFLNLRPLTAEEEILLSSSNEFSFELLKLIHQQNPDENAFFSSIGIGNGLGMAFNIINDKSKTEIKDFLGITGVNDNEINRAYFQLGELLNKIDPNIQYLSANSFWINQETPIEIMAENKIMAYYDAEVQLLNFNNPKNIKFINKWAEDMSFGRITSVVDQISSDDKSYMINLLHFDMNHSIPFKKMNVSDYTFTSAGGLVTKIKTLNQYEGDMGFYQSDYYSIIDIPLGQGHFSLTILAPENPDLISDIIQGLNYVRFNEELLKLETKKQCLIIPDITLEKEVRLRTLFPKMGITDPIKVVKYEYLKQNLFVSDFIHKASFTFGETMSKPEKDNTLVDINIKESPLNQISINSSFIFFIREKSINAIIFGGKMSSL